MDLPVFPIFAIKVRGDYVIAGGGGGNPAFGKKNGIVVYDLTTYKGICFCETDDVIDRFEVWDESERFGNLESDKKSFENMSYEEEDDQVRPDTIQSLPSKVESKSEARSEAKSEVRIEAKSEARHESKSEARSEAKSETRSESERRSNEPEKHTKQKTFHILACGLNNFYHIKLMNNEIQLQQKIEGRIEFCFFKEFMIFVYKNDLFGISNLKDIKIHQKPKKKNNPYKTNVKFDESHEEYFYQIRNSNDQLTFHREDLSTDIPENWISFFVVKDNVYKVLNQKNRYVFVFQGKRYEFEDEVCEPFYIQKQEELVFYLKGKKSQVCFFKRDSKKCVFIDKITALSVDGDVVSVANSDGKVYVFNEKRNYVIKKVYNIPITGCSVKNDFVYFCSFNGLIDRKKIGALSFYRYLFAFLAIIFSLVYYFMFKKQ